MANVLSRLGLDGAPSGALDEALVIESSGTADGTSSVSAGQDQELTTLGLGGYSVSTPLFQYYAVVDTATGTAAGTAVVDGRSSALWNSTGTAGGTSTAEAASTSPVFLTSLGLGGYSQTYPLAEFLTGDNGAGFAQGSSTALALSDVPIVEDVGSPDYGYIGAITGSGTSTQTTNVLVVNPTGGLTFGGTAPGLKGFSYTASGGLALAGTGGLLKSRTWVSTGGILFSGSSSGGSNVIKSFTFNPSGGILFAGTGSVAFFKNFGPGATGKIRDKRRLTMSTRSYSRG
jgi:hypothetical protein